MCGRVGSIQPGILLSVEEEKQWGHLQEWTGPFVFFDDLETVMQRMPVLRTPDTFEKSIIITFITPVNKLVPDVGFVGAEKFSDIYIKLHYITLLWKATSSSGGDLAPSLGGRKIFSADTRFLNDVLGRKNFHFRGKNFW